jgi:hypothetical protein
MAGTYALTTAQVGTVIDNTAGKIASITYTSKAAGYDGPAYDPISGFPTRGFFTLVDTGYNPLGSLRPLISVEATNSGFSPGAVLNFSNFPYTSLKLQSCPAGATITVTTQ